jgi:AcrR family transcriptional regulator
MCGLGKPVLAFERPPPPHRRLQEATLCVPPVSPFSMVLRRIKNERPSFFNTEFHSFWSQPPMAQVKKIEVRDRILAAATRLFAERSYVLVTVNQIAKAANTAPSNVYVYFRSKLEIVFAIYAPWLKEHLEVLTREVEVLSTPEAKVLRVVQKLWRDIPADRNAFANNLIQAVSSATQSDCYDPALLRWTEQKIATILSRALPPTRAAEIDCIRLAHILMMAFDGFAMNYHIRRAIHCDDGMIEEMCAGILGIRVAALRRRLNDKGEGRGSHRRSARGSVDLPRRANRR